MIGEEGALDYKLRTAASIIFQAYSMLLAGTVPPRCSATRLTYVELTKGVEGAVERRNWVSAAIEMQLWSPTLLYAPDEIESLEIPLQALPQTPLLLG